MAGQNIMSEHAAVRNESHQETFWSSLKDSVNYQQLYLFIWDLLYFFSKYFLKWAQFRLRHVGMSYITETGKTEVTVTELNGTYFHLLSLYESLILDFHSCEKAEIKMEIF